MASDDCWALYNALTWAQALYVEYLCERYDTHPNAVTSGIIREFAVRDNNLDLEKLSEHVAESPELQQSGKITLQVLRDIETLKARRNRERPTTPTTPPVNKRKRRYELWQSKRITLGILDFAIIHFYGTITSHAPAYVARHIFRVYMTADKRIKLEDLRAHLERVKEGVPKKQWPELEASWDNFADQWITLHRPNASQKARNKARRAS